LQECRNARGERRGLRYLARMTTPYRLHYAPDNASLCVRLALCEGGHPFETVLVDRRQSAQSTPTYLTLNPNGLIPTLETPDGPIFETAAILMWLSERHGWGMARGAGRGAALKWLFWLSNTLHPSLRMLFYPEKYLPSDPEALRSATHAQIDRWLTLLSAATDAQWLDADAASIHACYLAPMLRWPALYGGATEWYDLRRWPRLYDFAQRVETRPAAVKAATAEGLGPTPFSAPSAPNPPEGSAL